MHEHARALEVREELVAEADALARAFDQPGNVGHGQLAPSGASTVPRTGASVVNGYSATFGFAFEIRAQQRRLARVRQADERGVGEQLEPQLELDAPRRAPISAKRGAWRVGVAKRALPRPPLPPRASDDARAGRGEVGDEVAVAVEHLRADRDLELDVPPSAPCLRAPGRARRSAP